MSVNIPTAFVTTFQNNFELLLQQKNARLREAVTQMSFTGESAMFVEQFGQVSTARDLARHSDTPLMDPSQTRRWVYPHKQELGVLVDSFDKVQAAIDFNSPFMESIRASLARGIDDEIISGFFNSNNTGKTGTTTTGLLSAFNSGSQVVASTVGASAATGLNVAKLRAAMQLLMAAEVDVENDPLYMAISARQHDNLLAETQAISLDFGTKPVLENGSIKRFMGFNFIQSERIPGAASFNAAYNPAVTGYTTGSTWLVPFWAKSGVALGQWNDVTTEISVRGDKSYATQLYGKGFWGASRTQEAKCGMITCV